MIHLLFYPCFMYRTRAFFFANDQTYLPSNVPNLTFMNIEWCLELYSSNPWFPHFSDPGKMDVRTRAFDNNIRVLSPEVLYISPLFFLAGFFFPGRAAMSTTPLQCYQSCVQKSCFTR